MQTDKSIVYKKAEDFAVRTTKLWKYLRDVKKEYDHSLQLKRSGSSIAANIVEALYAESTKDFIHKFYIAEKECNESLCWINILFRTDYLTIEEYNSIKNDCLEIAKMIASIINTSKQKIDKEQINK